MRSRRRAARVAGGIAGGVFAGVVATAAMSAHMLGRPGRESIGTPPPQRLADTLLPREPDRVRRPVAAATHLAIGVTAGALYGTRRRRGPLRGALYGIGVWAVGYELVMPLLGVLPPAHRDDPARRSALIGAHLVYGSVLGLLSR